MDPRRHVDVASQLSMVLFRGIESDDATSAGICLVSEPEGISWLSSPIILTDSERHAVGVLRSHGGGDPRLDAISEFLDDAAPVEVGYFRWSDVAMQQSFTERSSAFERAGIAVCPVPPECIVPLSIALRTYQGFRCAAFETMLRLVGHRCVTWFVTELHDLHDAYDADVRRLRMEEIRGLLNDDESDITLLRIAMYKYWMRRLQLSGTYAGRALPATAQQLGPVLETLRPVVLDAEPVQ